jgi:hypothetical protein
MFKETEGSLGGLLLILLLLLLPWFIKVLRNLDDEDVSIVFNPKVTPEEAAKQVESPIREKAASVR